MRFFLVSTIGSRIRDARKAADLTQGDLAEKVETTQQNIQKLEKSDSAASKYLYPIAEVLGVDYEWLRFGDDKKPARKNMDDPETQIAVSLEVLESALKSVKAVMVQRGKDPKAVDSELIIKAFEVGLRGRLTGDYVTAALNISHFKKAN